MGYQVAAGIGRSWCNGGAVQNAVSLRSALAAHGKEECYSFRLKCTAVFGLSLYQGACSSLGLSLKRPFPPTRYLSGNGSQAPDPGIAFLVNAPFVPSKLVRRERNGWEVWDSRDYDRKVSIEHGPPSVAQLCD